MKVLHAVLILGSITEQGKTEYENEQNKTISTGITRDGVLKNYT